MSRALPAPSIPTIAAASPGWLRHLTVIAILTGLVVAVFGQVGTFDFVFWDDLDYVKRNPMLINGLTTDAVGQAFTTVHAHNWHPLTWISHMLDVELFGLNPGAHHLVNIAWHLLATGLLYAFLSTTTGDIWRSALVAALFAVHPLHVESVAWISERKDVLSATFGFATLLAYARYARSGRRRDYGLAMAAFAAGLASKPMLVTLPAILLLADIWPLNRLALTGPTIAGHRVLRDRLFEKLPFLALSLGSAAITVVAQEHALISMTRIPFAERLSQALHSAAMYLWQTVWPADLIFFYPMRGLGALELALAGATLGALAFAAAISWRRGHSAPAVGAAWYAVSLLPVIGIVQVGNQAHADRYTYLPLVGIFIMLSWSLPAFPQRRLARATLGGMLACAIVLLSVLAWQQTRHWRNGPSLMAHALAVDPNNNIALVKYGEMKLFAGALDEAEILGRRALEAATKQQTSTYAFQLLGSVAYLRGDLRTAILHYRAAIANAPGVAVYRYNLGVALLAAQDPAGATRAFEEAVAMQPDYPEALINLGVSYQRQGNTAGAIAAYRRALAVSPDDPTARLYLARRLRQAGEQRAAIVELRALLDRHPDHAEGRTELRELLGDNP